mgnify:FL=1
MTVWRPASAIRVKAIGLAWHEGRLLAAEVLDDRGQVKGVRPLGGSVEFGERWQDALAREFAEELGLAVTIEREAGALENIYTHEGFVGHEVIFVADVLLPAGTIQRREEIRFSEHDGVPYVARWFDVSLLDQPGEPALYPEGLRELLAP